ncbi:L,D-transpeptidase family protein [Streptomyces sp. NPDC021020]|uniref:L,D-transpeptidase family protein n=1 Tax=Streptomyces sp. NPDC021020 TaxID=3365109 RepID=UPI0037B73898
MVSPSPRVLLSGLGAVVLTALAGCGTAVGSGAQDHAATSGGTPPGAVRTVPAPAPTTASPAPRMPAGIGPDTLARIPRQSRQLVVVAGRGIDSSQATVVVYSWTADGWQPGAAWPAHNAKDGWTADHHGGDLRSPIGVFTLSDAGGLRADPGSKLPYHHSGGFHIGGRGFEGEPLAGSFDYVVAIDYNRKPGTTPLDWTRPLGAARGGGIWFHVDHGGPTHGCVSVSEAHMKQLLATLDPALHPVVVMGDAASLAA